MAISSTSSSPNHHIGNCFFSAPTSPARTSSSDKIIIRGSERPVATTSDKKSSSRNDDDSDDNFEFHFGGQSQRTADELFDSGKIKPLHQPPPPNGVVTDSLESPTTNAKERREKALSPRNYKKCDFAQLAAAIEQSRRHRTSYSAETELYVLSPRGIKSPMSRENRDVRTEKRERGRERAHDSSTSSRKQRGTRSVSPFKVSEGCRKLVSSSSTTSSKVKDSSSSKRWKLRDLWLRKSSEDGVIKKYCSVMKKSGGGGDEDAKESSFGSTESGGGARRRGMAAAAAHERHYAAKKAAAEEMRRKTVLPYKHGLLGLGCMGFNLNPSVHEISRGIGSLTRG